MQNFHKKEAIANAKRMIRAFFLERNVEEVFKYINPENFTWIGPGENDVLTNIDDIRQHFEEHCKIVTAAYKIISEEYTLGASSSDSCIVIAKIKFAGMKERQNFQSSLNFSFYFQLIDDKMLVSHYQVNIPIKNPDIENVAQFIINKNANPEKLIKMDLQYQDNLLKNFFDAKHMAMKSFCYEGDFPYCYVNEEYLKLLGYNELRSFISEEKFSSLVHIHPYDQQRYVEQLAEKFPKTRILDSTKEWQWHASYNIAYRTQSYDKKSKNVFEWGNLLTLNGHPLVNSFVLPLEEKIPDFENPEEIFSKIMGHSANASTLLDDVGIHIGNIMIIYPKHHKLVIRGNLVDLTPTEFKILLILTNELNKVVEADKFYDSIWNDDELKFTSFTLKTHMSKLRRKLKTASEDTIKLENIRNKGYCLKIEEI